MKKKLNEVREVTNKFLTHVVDGLGIEEDSVAYEVIRDLCSYLSEDEVEDFIKQYGYDEEVYEEIYTVEADDIRNTIQEELSNDQRIKLYNMYNVDEIEEWNEETEQEFWDWIDILDSDELEDLSDDIDKLKSGIEESKEVKTEDIESDTAKKSAEAKRFSGVEFEKRINDNMRFKEYYPVEDDENLYWVTQQFFDYDDVITFIRAFRDKNNHVPFNRAYITVRDLSSYDFKEDLKKDVLVVIDKEGNESHRGYAKAADEYGYIFSNGVWKEF